MGVYVAMWGERDKLLDPTKGKLQVKASMKFGNQYLYPDPYQRRPREEEEEEEETHG